MIIFSIMPVVLRMGLNNALLRSWYDYEESERPKLAATVLIFLGVTSVPLLLLLALGSQYISQLIFQTPAYSQHLRIILLLTFFEVFNVVPDTLLRLRNASVRYSLCQTLGFIVQLGVIIFSVAYLKRGIEGVLLGNLAGSACENGLMFFSARKDLRWGFNRAELRIMLAFGVPIIFGRIAASVFQWIDRFFLKHYTTLRIVGIYSLGNQLATPVSLLITTPFSMIWANMQFSAMKDDDAKEYYARMLTYVVFAASTLALPLAILIEDVLRIFARDKYWEAATIVPWLAFNAVLDAANPVLNIGLSLKRKSIHSASIFIIAALINVGLNFIIIPPFGMMGATIATVISYIVMLAIKYFISQHFVHVDFEWARIGKVFACAFALFILSRTIDIHQSALPFCARLPFVHNSADAAKAVAALSFLVHLPFGLLLPVALLPLGFYDDKERNKVSELLQRARNYWRAPEMAKEN
jgi:O-antigen/teichoic acid export membrane protein